MRERSRSNSETEEIIRFKKISTAKEEAQIQFNSYKLFKSEAFMEHSLSLDNTNAQSVIAYLKYLIENNQRKMLIKKY